MYILSQILVVLSDLIFIISMLNKKKKNIVFFLIVSNILFAAHYLCLHSFIGAGIECIEIVFLISLNLLEKKDKSQYNIYLSIITIIVTIIVSHINLEYLDFSFSYACNDNIFIFNDVY